MSFHYEKSELSRDVVLWTLHETPTRPEWTSFLACVTEWLQDLERRGCRISVVVDPTGMPQPDAVGRTAISEWRAEHLPLIANTCRCAAYVADGPVWRSLLTAVFWFARPVVPVQVCSNRGDALDWVQSRG
jgi:hypothetical protein